MVVKEHIRSTCCACSVLPQCDVIRGSGVADEISLNIPISFYLEIMI
jgi:hypothetical protein